MLEVKIPHIKYISEFQELPISQRTFYYIGGEPEENHSRLTVGKKYLLRTASYSESRDIARVSVWICSDDENMVCRINPKNFGTFADIRNKKIEEVLDGTNLSKM